MITLVLSMIRARPAQALVVFLLATFAVAASVSAPAYEKSADRAVVAGVVAAASLDQHTVQVRYATTDDNDTRFEEQAPQAFRIPGFNSIFSAEYDGFIDGKLNIAPRMVYRDDVCQHIRIVQGRCFATTAEIVVSPSTAKTVGAGVGSTVTARQSFFDPQMGWSPDSTAEPVQLTIVGLYEPDNSGDAYWSDWNYFDQRLTDRLVTSPTFMSRGTAKLVPHTKERQGLDVVVAEDAITSDSLQRVSTGVQGGVNKLASLDGASVTTKLPTLLKRTSTNRGLVADVVPIAAVPLVGLSWFVLFIAVAAGTQERRFELGLLALRGTRAPNRWWLAAGEAILPILAGSVAGYLFGHYAVRLATLLLLNRAGEVPLGTGFNRWTLITVAGALVAAVLAQRRELAAPAADLLRNIPSRTGRWRSAVAETVMVLLAVAAVVQLRAGHGGISGVGTLAPALVVFAVGLVAARVAGPIADRIGLRALRRGRLGPTLAAFAISRRPGSQRILALLVIAMALICFTATAAGVSSEARDDRVATELGAQRVVDVEPLTQSALLAKTHAADPEGKWAMAAALLPGNAGTVESSRTIAVDAPRLPAVTEWRGSSTASAVAAKLHPPAAASVPVTNKDFEIDATLTTLRDGFRVALVMIVAPLDGSDNDTVMVGPVETGTHTYKRDAPACVKGCRLVGFALQQPEGRPFAADLTLHEFRQGGKVVVSAEQFAAADAWRPPVSPGSKLQVAQVTTAPDGLRIALPSSNGNDLAFEALVGDFPGTLPAVVGDQADPGSGLIAPDSTMVNLTVADQVGQVPRFGRAGTMMDLDYVNRAAPSGRVALSPEVWLGPHAPADALERLRKQGLNIQGVRELKQQRAALDSQGPAVAVRFHELAAGFAIVLAAGALWLVAGVERRRRAGEIRALRAQGVSRREASTSGYLAMVGVAAAVGLLAGLVGWLLVGDQIPIFDTNVTSIHVPRWPPIQVLGLAWLVAGLALVATAVLAGARLRAIAGGARRSTPRRPAGRHEAPPPSEEPPLVDVSAVNTTPSIWRESR
jgi:putative ABC transport system permease protein